MIIKTVTEIEELKGIRLLQQLNLKSGISSAEASAEGFLTAEYTFEFLREMNNATPAIVAKDEHTVAGYALATTRKVAMKHDLLEDLFNSVDSISYDGKQLEDANYIVVGQLCVAKEYRGLGIVQQMYNKFKDTYSGKYEYCITDVAKSNPRSLKAHIKSGFKVVDTLHYGGIGWDIVLWDWRK